MSSEPAHPSTGDWPPSDQQLVRETRQGSVAGFEELVRRYQVPLLHFLKNRAGNRADAEDLTQDALVRAYENLHRYQPRYRFSTWLFTIAHRISLNQRRKRRPTSDSDGVESVPAGGADPEAVAIEKEQRGRLWDLAAATLSQPQMTALWLYYVEEMPVAEIANVLKRSRGATKTMLFRARKRLKPVLGAMERGAVEPEVVLAENKEHRPNHPV
jgi:RNA polymerase sigma-70 factor (ECF subfamily)